MLLCRVVPLPRGGADMRSAAHIESRQYRGRLDQGLHLGRVFGRRPHHHPLVTSGPGRKALPATDGNLPQRHACLGTSGGAGEIPATVQEPRAISRRHFLGFGLHPPLRQGQRARRILTTLESFTVAHRARKSPSCLLSDLWSGHVEGRGPDIRAGATAERHRDQSRHLSRPSSCVLVYASGSPCSSKVS